MTLRFIKKVSILHKFNFWYAELDTMHFLWFEWFNNKRYAFYWDWGGEIWWFPKIQIEKFGFRVGWLYGAIGIVKMTKQYNKTKALY